ncbi:GNAT family N-acetyltransferase [Terrilactibacillus sp. S3-3]|nr:GNAT family N-acetyltransferase [Terrilactibacillus sp. S3-3]
MIEDVHDIFQLFSDPETMRLDGGQMMVNMDEAAQLIYAYSSFYGPAVRWAITGRESNVFYGTAGFHHIDYFSNKAELGGELLKKYWNLGIASEAFPALLDFGFDNMAFNRIEARLCPRKIKALFEQLNAHPLKKKAISGSFKGGVTNMSISKFIVY